jgi:hypothetical protein
MLPRSIQKFILNPQTRAQWFEEGEVHVYLRHARHLIRTDKDPRILETLDIASITVQHPGKGHFTNFLMEVENFVQKHTPSQTIYIENVLSQRFAQFFTNRGYQPCNAPDQCFIHLLSL